MADKHTWLLYVALAGLSWGTYVPLIFFGGTELGGKPGSRIMAILCVGVAYFVIAVLVPLVLFFTGVFDWPEMTSNGLAFSSLAGIAGAVGAICVIFASKAAMATGMAVKAEDPTFNPATYRMYIGPLIFGLAPVINTLVSIFWHPEKGHPFHFGFDMPGWKLWLGIIMVGAGAALVLFSKEEAEAGKGPKPLPPPPPAVAKVDPGTPGLGEATP